VTDAGIILLRLENMGIESFPEIENFQKLPREVIIKGASTRYDQQTGAELRGIVINNIGQPIKQIRAQLVVFGKNKVPVLGTSAGTDPEKLPQGGIANFHFHLKDFKQEIKNYHLHVTWGFDERP
jgi:hypothetical protein